MKMLILSYMLLKMYNGKYTVAELFSSQINGSNVYVGNPSFTKDGKTVYFTKCELEDALVNTCQIYRSYLGEGVWTKPEMLPSEINEKGSYTSQPHITENEEGKPVLYFVAERESGRGGKDIYIALINEDGSFQKAKNIGSPINTRYDDLSPFYDAATKTLYYSTDGELSFGGLDIYKSEWKENEGWQEPVNAGQPLNTSLDDYDFVLNEKGNLGYLVSNRVGTTTLRSETCCDDIFEVRTTQVDLYVAGVVYAENATSRVLAKNANVVLKNITNESDEELTFTNDKFVFKVNPDENYELNASLANFKDVMLTFNTDGINKSDTLFYDLFLNQRKDLMNVRIGVVYYEFDMSKLRSDAPDTLKNVLLILKSYPKTMVEVSSHTDSKGTDEYNMALSEFRTEAVSNYLIKEGVDKNRIIQKWFGESMPAASNTNPDGSDNEAGRALNRRTEFKIVGEVDDINIEQSK
ncbi:MAG: OmpA family protein [Chitinophagales bacterium]|nr:OmpA family protein [Chitinophagales bacterium]